MKRIIQSALIFAGLMLTSCEDVVQVKLDKGATLYVVDAFINDLRTPQEVKLSMADAYFSNQEAPPLNGAEVILKDLTAGREYQFTDRGNGSYVYDLQPGDTIAYTGHSYQLLVKVDGVTYSALSKQRRKAAIDSISTILIEPGGGFGPPGPAFYVCQLAAKDPSGSEADYYWIKTFRNDSLQFSASQINVAIDGTNGEVGNIDADSTAFTPPITFLGFNQFNPGNTCRVEIHSLERETYFFFTQAAQQVNNGGLFATTPENVRTNILTPSGASIKTVGWFNMAGVTSKSVTIPN